jgi:hypothetical protein
MDITQTEAADVAADRQLAQLIERRSDRSPDPDEAHELWRESLRRYNSEQHEANRAAWQEFYLRLADTHERLCGENRRKAAALEGAAWGEGA